MQTVECIVKYNMYHAFTHTVLTVSENFKNVVLIKYLRLKSM